ncbi:MAG: hypothetical protein POELPBGB_02531 [Bacteroidia bacterium]|nr:hypothetical protein [Bacteroidia bacterium]
MKTKITLFIMAFFSAIMQSMAQTACTDWNGYVDSKNTSTTGYYTLINGFEENVAQTYHYSGPGKVSQVRVYGEYPFSGGGVPLRVTVYDVDANGRPIAALQSEDITWWFYDNSSEYLTVSFGSGVSVNSNFAIGVSLRSGSPFASAFRVKYTGDGEGLGEDLASISGSSTGFNWTSAMDNFNRDGDFYLVPQMTNYVISSFEASAQCVGTGVSVSFENFSQLTQDSMFNIIGWSGYSGSEEYFSWNFGDGSAVSNAASPSHSFSTPGVYTVSLTTTVDGWEGACTDVYSVQVSVGLSASAGTVENASCYGSNDGSVTGSGSGGATPYTYSLNGFSYQSSPTFGDLAAGQYALYVRDALGCVSTTSFTVTQPSQIVISSASSTNASCGNSNGGILVTATGGTGTLQYKLDNGAYQSTGSFSNLASGSYVVTVKDANNCTVSANVTVNNFGAPTLSVLSTTNVSCNGGDDGTIILNATGGTGTLQYSIDGGDNFQTSGSFTSLEAGTYSVLVKDNAGCTAGFTVVISEPQSLSFTLSATSVSCYDGDNGSITVTSATGGIGAFSYSIDGVNYQSGTEFNGLSAASYTVYLKDAASCISSQTIVVTQPDELQVAAAVSDVTCYNSEDGSINATGDGGTGSYSYSLDGEDFQPSGIFNNLDAGDYTLTIMDQNKCSVSISVTIDQPTQVSATYNTTNSTCGNSNGGLLITGSGGSGSGYEYSIDGINYNSTGAFTGLAAGTYYFIVRDDAGCGWVYSATIIDSNGPQITSLSHTDVSCNGGNDGTISINTVTGGTGVLEYSIDGINWQTDDVFTGLSADVYAVSVKDANGCIGTQTVVVTEPNALVVSTNLSDADCYGENSGSATILASGGAGTLAYSINGVTFQSSNSFTGLAAGMYTVVIRDAAGCTTDVYFAISQPTQIEITTGVLNVSCNGAGDGRIIANATGGTGNIQYSIDATNFQSSHLFNNLDGGTYVVTARDANGCRTSEVVTVEEPEELVVYYTLSDVTCHGGDNGVIDLTVFGGTAPYSFAWSNFSASEDIFNLAPGVYSVTVTDAHNCETSNSFTIEEPSEPIIVNGDVTNPVSATSNDGEIDITVSGGTEPYSYSWSNGETTQDLTDLAPGLYVVTVTDYFGCTTIEIYIVGDPTGIEEANAISNNISVYPNPATNYVTVEANGYSIEIVRIVDMLGQTVSETQVNSSKTQLDVTTLSQGAYFVQLLVNDQLITKRMNVTK